MNGKILYGNCCTKLKTLPKCSVDMCLTSPPYYGLRDYGHCEQIGLEKTPKLYIDKLVHVFGLVHESLKEDGTLWIVIGDSYASKSVAGIKCKDLIGIPWMLAFALRDYGWYLRQDIIWHKPNAMPSAVKDRCTSAHEYLFLLSKSRSYYYDHNAIKTDASPNTKKRNMYGFKGAFKGQFCGTPNEQRHQEGRKIDEPKFSEDGKANRRSVWSVCTQSYKGSHYAVFPTTLVEPCIIAGCRPKGIVLDPFMGSGTTAEVAIMNNRRFLGVELNRDYKPLITERVRKAEAQRKNLF